jgi:hypothetical protein
MMRATCHCGAVVIEADRRPRAVTACNCSICRRLGAQWAYYTRKSARIVRGATKLKAYAWGDKVIEFFHCKTCGCATHYESIEKNPAGRFAINSCCFALEDVADIRVRHFDGAYTWKYLD